MQVSINMAMSIDGKIATKDRGPVKLGSSADSRRMAEIRADHDVVINGASTFRAYPMPLIVKGDDLLRRRRRKGLSPQPASAVVSSRLDIPRGTPWERARHIDRWIFCGKRALKSTIVSLRLEGVNVLQSRSERPSPQEILEAFAAAGLSRVLVEGGGEFNASFLERGLVDTIHLTIPPVLIGGVDSPTWCEGAGFKKGEFPRFQLARVKNVKGELFLTYEK